MREFYKQQITDQFSYHPPKSEDIAKLAENTREHGDQYVALAHVRQAVMWADASIVIPMMRQPYNE